jgi:hypothetical protein
MSTEMQMSSEEDAAFVLMYTKIAIPLTDKETEIYFLCIAIGDPTLKRKLDFWQQSTF